MPSPDNIKNELSQYSEDENSILDNQKIENEPLTEQHLIVDEIATGMDIEEDNDDVQLKKFLETINMETLFRHLKAAQVTFRSLPYLKEKDLEEAVPALGLRVEFGEKLLTWQRTELGISSETISVPNKVEEWLKRNETDIPSKSHCANNAGVLLKDLKTVLSETFKGRSILEYANQNHKLTSVHRDDLISIAIEEIISLDLTLSPQDFRRLLDEICSVFPFENAMQDYYYIPRKGKSNQSGRLYSKYKSKILKKRRSLALAQSSSQAVSPVPENQEFLEIDESTAALKITLRRNCANWKKVCENWKKTYHMRQSELKIYESVRFLQEWPKLAHSNMADLINIDFDILHPSKGQCLISKWKKFKEKIGEFYKDNICTDYSKQLLNNASLTANTDGQDYIYTILLCAAIPSQARFKCGGEKRSKRVSIRKSQESFILRLTNIATYKRKIEAIRDKFYSVDLTIQPFLIVEGSSDMEPKAFYIYFNNILLKFNTFLHCLDTGFKIFHTMSLKYPEACELPWTFIQKYFYDINKEKDSKSSNVTSLMNYCSSTE